MSCRRHNIGLRPSLLLTLKMSIRYLAMLAPVLPETREKCLPWYPARLGLYHSRALQAPASRSRLLRAEENAQLRCRERVVVACTQPRTIAIGRLVFGVWPVRHSTLHCGNNSKSSRSITIKSRASWMPDRSRKPKHLPPAEIRARKGGPHPPCGRRFQTRRQCQPWQRA